MRYPYSNKFAHTARAVRTLPIHVAQTFHPDTDFDWFVDSVKGKDTNSGKSPGAALKTIAALLAETIERGQRIGLARGSRWREQLTLPADGLTVGVYGSGNRPLLDCSDIIPAGSWTKTVGQANVYQAAITLYGNAGAPHFVSAWENDVRLVRAADVAACDATPGSYFPSSEDTGAIVLYVHASDDSDPATNGKVYEYSAREFGLTGADGNTFTGIHTRRNLHCNGSISGYADTKMTDCVASEGNKHCLYAGPGSVVRNCEADRLYYTSDAFMMVYNGGNLNGEAVLFDNCYCHDAGSPTGVGIGGHSNDSTTFGTVTYQNCRVSGTTRAYSMGNLAAARFINCTGTGTEGGTAALSVSDAATVLIDGCTISNPGHNAIQLDKFDAPATITIQNSTLTAGTAFYSANNSCSLDLLGNTFNCTGFTFYFNGTGIVLASSGNTFDGSDLYYYFDKGFGSVDSDYNTFAAPGTNVRFRGPWETAWTFAEWQAAGRDVHSTIT